MSPSRFCREVLIIRNIFRRVISRQIISLSASFVLFYVTTNVSAVFRRFSRLEERRRKEQPSDI